ncbi:glycosyl hydrolase family 18 protein [Enterococcus mundtii]|uniref:glycosyl hydrolase family 18 protein n=1 Tax=Enterococcus TaxID=1350 RepID=UPI00188441C6|nr:glycosyl hydrolase family 18 protein [Enterococcus mundtii]MBE9909753.1 chitinase [Enterococcus mundtii]GKS53652.1 chitinase [Enterococcus mundtii]
MKRIKSISLVALLFSSIVAMTLPAFNESPEVHAEEVRETQVAPYRNVMYYGDWSIWGGEGNFYPKDIPADQITHLNFAFLDFDSNGDLEFTDTDAAVGAPVGQTGVQWNSASSGILNAIQDLRGKNPNMKIGVSLGGWSKSGDFSEVAADPVKRQNLVENVTRFIKYTNMDFVDVDWEYPADVRQPDLVDNVNDEGTPNAVPEDKENYIILLNEIRESIDEQGEELGKTYELSVALPASQSKLSSGIDIDGLFEVVDFANIMTYDMNGGWGDRSGHHTALYGNPADPNYDQGLSVDQTVQFLRDEGAPAEKIVIGAAFYTRGWHEVAEGNDPLLPGLFQTAEQSNRNADLTATYGAKNKSPLVVGDGGRAGGVWPYRNIPDLISATSGLTEYWDDVAKAPYMYSTETGEFFSFDNERSIGYKTQYVQEEELGGVISWMQSQDKETTSTKRDELTNAIKEGLFGNTPLPQHEIVSTPLDISVDITPYTENNVSGYEITLTNNETLTETSTVLSAVEAAQKTVKLPKLMLELNSNETLTSGNFKAGDVTTTNGMVTVDLATVYDGRELAPGASYDFRLQSDTSQVSVDHIDTITLSQRIGTDGIEINHQVIFGVEAPDPSDVEAPSIPTNVAATTINATEVTLNWTASTDNQRVAGYFVYRDGQLVGQPRTPSFTDTGLAPDTQYTYTVKAFDASNNVSAASQPVIVRTLEDSVPGYAAWDASTVYLMGDRVTHLGNAYRAKWWTQGDEPGTQQWGPWELIN